MYILNFKEKKLKVAEGFKCLYNVWSVENNCRGKKSHSETCGMQCMSFLKTLNILHKK